MSMETKRPRRAAHSTPDPGAGYERRDANLRGVLEFGFWLAMVLLITLVGIRWTYHYFARTQPVGPPASPFTNVREIPPGPLLQAAPHADLQTYCEAQQQVNTYGWVDQQQGVVRLPVDRAMDLLLERGLPVRALAEVRELSTLAQGEALRESSAGAEPPFLPNTEDAQGQCNFVEEERQGQAPIESNGESK